SPAPAGAGAPAGRSGGSRLVQVSPTLAPRSVPVGHRAFVPAGPAVRRWGGGLVWTRRGWVGAGHATTSDLRDLDRAAARQRTPARPGLLRRAPRGGGPGRAAGAGRRVGQRA